MLSRQGEGIINSGNYHAYEAWALFTQTSRTKFHDCASAYKRRIFQTWGSNTLKSCVKEITFYASESQADLQDSAQNKLKELEDELVLKLRSAIRQQRVHYRGGIRESTKKLWMDFVAKIYLIFCFDWDKLNWDFV